MCGEKTNICNKRAVIYDTISTHGFKINQQPSKALRDMEKQWQQAHRAPFSTNLHRGCPVTAEKRTC